MSPILKYLIFSPLVDEISRLSGGDGSSDVLEGGLTEGGLECGKEELVV